MTKLKVLAKPKIGSSNPRNSIMYSFIEEAYPEIRVDEFLISRLLAGDYDILHIHWPDRIFRSRDIVAVLKVFALWAMLLWARLRGMRVVWTVHNPYLKNRYPRRVLQRIYYWVLRTYVDRFVFPSSASRREFFKLWSRVDLVPPDLANCEFIPLGLQIELLDGGEEFPVELPPNLDNYYLIVGRVDVDKNIRSTVTDLEGALVDKASRIVVAGMPKGPEMGAMLDELGELPRVTVLPRFLEDREVNSLMKRACAVVIDYPVTNSGVATLAAANDANILFSNQEMADDFAADYGYQRCAALRNACGKISRLPPKFVASDTIMSNDKRISMAAVGERYAQSYLEICS